MARPGYEKALFKTPGLMFISGRFKTVNGADPTDIEGAGFTVARTAEGKWTVTLDATYVALNCVIGSAMLATAAADAGDLEVHFDPVASATACSSFVVYLSQDGTDADVPGAWVQFIACLRGTIVKR